MRGTAPGVGTPYPIAELLPATLQEDRLLCRLTAALDQVLAPAVSTVDCLDAYLDPALTPDDFLDWLGGWVGAVVDAGWPTERRRAAVSGAVPLYASRGTVAGLRAQLELLTGAPVEVRDSGGVSVSDTPTDDADAHEPWLAVTASTVDADVLPALDAVIAQAKPAHVPHSTTR